MKALILDLHKNLHDIVGESLNPEDYQSYKASFWSDPLIRYPPIHHNYIYSDFDRGTGRIGLNSLQAAMRRAGQNPTDVEIVSLINKYDNDTGYIDFKEFCFIMQDVAKEDDEENRYKETFRVFSKDVDGCIHPDEIKFVLKHLPSQLDSEEIEEMIDIVDRNKDGKISYSEFRVMLGAIPLLIPDDQIMKPGRNSEQ